MKDSRCGNYVPTPNSRREFLRQTGLGMGTLAFGTMVADYLVSDAQAEVMANLKPRKAPLAAKAKHVIHIFAGGAPSHLDTFDPKPKMKELADMSAAGMRGVLFPTPFEFKKSGKSDTPAPPPLLLTRLPLRPTIRLCLAPRPNPPPRTSTRRAT